MLRLGRIRFLLILSFALIFTACGGGGTSDSTGSSGGGGTTQPQKTVSISATISTPASMTNTTFKLLSAMQEIDYAGGGSSLTVGTTPQILMAVDASDNLIYMGLSTGTAGEQVTLDAASTAKALLLMHPTVGSLTETQLLAFLPMLDSLPEVSAVATAIENSIAAHASGGTLWSTSMSTQLQQSIATAIVAADAAIQSNNVVSIQSNTSITQPLKQASASADTTNVSPSWVNLKSHTPRSGLKVSLHQWPFGAAVEPIAPTNTNFHVDIGNTKDRFVMAYFPTYSQEKLLGPKQPDDTRAFSDLDASKLTNSDAQDISKIEIFGPAYSGGLPANYNPLHIAIPAVATMVKNSLTPFAMLVTGDANCANIIGSTITQLALNKISLDTFVIKSPSDTNNAIFALGDLFLSEVKSGAISCAAGTAARQVVKYFGATYNAIKTLADLFVTQAIAYKDLGASSLYEVFYVFNDAVVGAIGVDSQKQIGTGTFTGTCLPAPQEICRRFEFASNDVTLSDNTLSIPVSFYVSCLAACSNIDLKVLDVIEPVVPVIDGSVIRLDYNFTSEGIYPVSLIITDATGATDQVEFQIELATDPLGIWGQTLWGRSTFAP